ncbi:MAG TPA: glutamate racemase [Nitrospinota bacterium]|nr:glutamate racemase [Nitrospinota bacterium]
MVSKPIGIFDSGVGGLTVLREIMRLLPKEDIIYIGDTARVPYGTKSAETVSRYALQNTNLLIKKNIKLLVVACNTASSLSLPFLEERFHIPIVGVIKPGVKRAIEITKNGKIGVIGTEATIKSRAYEKMLKELVSSIQVYSKACPMFVPLVEEGWIDNDVAYIIAKKYLKELGKRGIDTLILGCTHYPLLKATIGDIMGKRVRLIDSAVETAKFVKMELLKNGILADKSKAVIEFLVTDLPEKFASIGTGFLEYKLENVTHVDLDSNI